MYISHRFGDGYIVLLRIKGQSPELTPIMNYMSSTFPKAVLKECHHNMLQVYRAGQMTQEEHLVQDCSISSALAVEIL